MRRFFLIPPDVLQNSSDPPPPPPQPPPHNKSSQISFCIRSWIDHPLGLLKVKAGNLRGILIVVRVKLQIRIISTYFTRLTRNLEDNFLSYLHISFAMGNRLPWQQRDIAISQLSDLV